MDSPSVGSGGDCPVVLGVRGGHRGRSAEGLGSVRVPSSRASSDLTHTLPPAGGTSVKPLSSLRETRAD